MPTEDVWRVPGPAAGAVEGIHPFPKGKEHSDPKFFRMRSHRPQQNPVKRGFQRDDRYYREACGFQVPTSLAELDPRSLSPGMSVANERKTQTPPAISLYSTRVKTPWPFPQCCLPDQLCLPIPDAAKVRDTATQIPPV